MIDKFRLKKGVWKNIKNALDEHSDILDIFSKNLFKNKNFYSEMEINIKNYATKNKLKIIDAF